MAQIGNPLLDSLQSVGLGTRPRPAVRSVQAGVLAAIALFDTNVRY